MRGIRTRQLDIRLSRRHIVQRVIRLHRAPFGWRELAITGSDSLSLDEESFEVSPMDHEAAPGSQADPSDQNAFTPAAVECLVSEAWQDLFNSDRVGRGGNFFELGGDSLMAIKLITRLTVSLGIQLPLETIFLHPTVCEIAAFIERTYTHCGELAQEDPLQGDTP
jgi:acyl carrier protein